MKASVLITFSLLVFFAFQSCNKAKLEPICETTEDVTYDTHVKTIIDNNCMKCHDSGSNNGEFDTYAGLEAVTANGEFEKQVLVDQSMPRFADLTQTDINILQCWFEAGFPEN